LKTQATIKNISCFVFLFFIIIKSYSQQLITGKIIDSDNGSAISKVLIINIDNNRTITSNSVGEFQTKAYGTYKLIKTGYTEKTIVIENSKYIIIQLNINPFELNEIIVSANHIPQQLKKAVSTIDIISSKDIERGNNYNINTILNKTPSVFMQSGALNTNRITIRGIGSRNAFGTSKIRAYFQDIPLTSGNGETTIEDFELATISRFEIIKGAASSVYGSGLGGTIHLIPQNAYLNQTIVNSELSIGSFGLIKGIVNINHGSNKNSIRAVYSNTHSDGYRDNNEYDRQTFTVNTNHYISSKDELTFLASYVDLKAFIPSSINETTYINNPKAAPFTWAQSKGYEDSQRGIFGLSWNHQYNNSLKQITSIFKSFRNGYEPRPFNVLSEKTAALGIRSRLLGHTKSLKWTLGFELFKDTYKSGTFENLYKDFPEGTGSVIGNPLSSFKEKRTYYNIFFETNYDVTANTRFSIGLNFNQTKYNLDDTFAEANNTDLSGSYEFDGILSPKIGVSHQFSENVTLYSNVSHGFSPPTISETLLPDGLINTNIKPETGWNYEIGSRASFFNNRLQLNTALFRMDIRNLLVARRTADDQYIGINAGKTQHDGLELTLNYQLVQSDAVSIRNYITYTLNDFKFKEFTDDNDDFSGNKLTGVPSEVFNAGIDINMTCGFYGTINFQHVGSMPITDSNSLFSDNYNLTNIKTGFKFSVLKKLKINAYFGLDNVFDTHYASQILINASGFGGAAPRYYYPGNPINYFTGMNINYQF
jgi:iron complex outermembrane receptor protein